MYEENHQHCFCVKSRQGVSQPREYLSCCICGYKVPHGHHNPEYDPHKIWG